MFTWIRDWFWAVSNARSLLTENDKLRGMLSDKLCSDVVIREASVGDGSLALAVEGGAAGLFAEMLVRQYKDGGGINYAEMSFVSRTVCPDERFVVTVQRVAGKTPADLKAEADAEISRLCALHAKHLPILRVMANVMEALSPLVLNRELVRDAVKDFEEASN